MKKLVLLVLAMFAIVISAMAQSPEMVAVNEYFGSIATLVALVPLITQFPKKWFNLQGIWIQVVSWLISVALAFIGWGFGLGMFVEITVWWHVLAVGVGVGLAANGVFDISYVRMFLNWLFGIK